MSDSSFKFHRFQIINMKVSNCKVIPNFKIFQSSNFKIFQMSNFKFRVERSIVRREKGTGTVFLEVGYMRVLNAR